MNLRTVVFAAAMLLTSRLAPADPVAAAEQLVAELS